jgi:hypothetical protein
MSRSGFSDAISDTVKRRGLDRPKGAAPGITLARHAESLDANRLGSLILELALARGAYFAWSSTWYQLRRNEEARINHWLARGIQPPHWRTSRDFTQ